MKIIRRVQTSANAHGCNNSPNILKNADRIFIKILPEIVERILPPYTSNGTLDQTKTADHIFMKILTEIYTGIRKSSLQFGSHP